MRPSTVLLCSLPLYVLSGCDDRYLVGFGPDAAGGAGTGGTSTTTGGATGGTSTTTGAGGATGGSGGTGGGPAAGGATGGTGFATGGGPAAGGATGGTGVSTGGTGGTSTTGGTGGTGGGPATDGPAWPSSSCGVAPAPMPVRPLAVSSDHVADRLARFLWADRPDAPLLTKAAALKTSADVQALAAEMLRDPRADAAVRALMRRWLRLDQLLPPQPANPLWAAAVRESDAFVTNLVLRDDGALTTLLTASHTYVDDPALGAFYGVSGLSGFGQRRITPAPDQRRSGILTHASVLMSRPRATTRGMWILDAFMCVAVPMPPPEFAAPPLTGAGTARQRLEQSTSSQTACQACHRMIDPPGFALERYDEVGRFRETDNGLPVDDGGHVVLPSSGGNLAVPFRGAGQLGAALAQTCEVKACAVQSLLAHALAGPLRPADEPSKHELAAAFAHAGFNLKELLIAITGSGSFLAP